MVLEMQEVKDVIIIGGASAGLTAAIYAARRAMKTLVITKDIGGQANLSHIIENYPGFSGVSGVDLMQKFYEQALESGAEIIFDEVSEIKETNGNFLVKAITGEHVSKTIILAFGKTPRSLEVPGEKEFQGKGVSYCAICDIPLFKDKTIAVVGGGNSALDAAINGSDIAKKVYLIHRRKEFRAFEYMIKKVKQRKNVEFVLDTLVKEVRGDKFVRSIIVKNILTNEVKEIAVDGVFVEIGSEVKTDFVKGLVRLDGNNQIIINDLCETFYPSSDKKRPGVFAAGDVTNTPFKQIVSSAGDGCKAALQTYIYLTKTEIPFIADWVHKVKK